MRESKMRCHCSVTHRAIYSAPRFCCSHMTAETSGTQECKQLEIPQPNWSTINDSSKWRGNRKWVTNTQLVHCQQCSLWIGGEVVDYSIVVWNKNKKDQLPMNIFSNYWTIQDPNGIQIVKWNIMTNTPCHERMRDFRQCINQRFLSERSYSTV